MRCEPLPSSKDTNYTALRMVQVVSERKRQVPQKRGGSPTICAQPCVRAPGFVCTGFLVLPCRATRARAHHQSCAERPQFLYGHNYGDSETESTWSVRHLLSVQGPTNSGVARKANDETICGRRDTRAGQPAFSLGSLLTAATLRQILLHRHGRHVSSPTLTRTL